MAIDTTFFSILGAKFGAKIFYLNNIFNKYYLLK